MAIIDPPITFNNSYIPSGSTTNWHVCTQFPCPYCPPNWPQWNPPYIPDPNNTTYIPTSTAWCVECDSQQLFPHICKGLEVKLLKLQLQQIQDESLQQAKLIARYRSLLEEFQAAIKAELE